MVPSLLSTPIHPEPQGLPRQHPSPSVQGPSLLNTLPLQATTLGHPLLQADRFQPQPLLFGVTQTKLNPAERPKGQITSAMIAEGKPIHATEAYGDLETYHGANYTANFWIEPDPDKSIEEEPPALYVDFTMPDIEAIQEITAGRADLSITPIRRFKVTTTFEGLPKADKRDGGTLGKKALAEIITVGLAEAEEMLHLVYSGKHTNTTIIGRPINPRHPALLKQPTHTQFARAQQNDAIKIAEYPQGRLSHLKNLGGSRATYTTALYVFPKQHKAELRFHINYTGTEDALVQDGQLTPKITFTLDQPLLRSTLPKDDIPSILLELFHDAVDIMDDDLNAVKQAYAAGLDDPNLVEQFQEWREADWGGNKPQWLRNGISLDPRNTQWWQDLSQQVRDAMAEARRQRENNDD